MTTTYHNQILIGDVREVLPTLPDGIVDCVVTSPPYFGLRDYGVDGQIGLEANPDAYVEQIVSVFREVRRVLRDDGTVWLNLGDSYGSGEIGRHDSVQANNGRDWSGTRKGKVRQQKKFQTGLKPKDLIGIPWALAKALRDPYYAGRIPREIDRAWMAATLDAEGTICGFTHERKDDGSIRTGVHITITNTSTLLLDNAQRIWPASRSEHQRHSEGHLGDLDSYRWIVHGIENKLLFLREIYPYLIVKRRQAVLAYNLLLLMADAKRLGHSPQKSAVWEKRALLVGLMSDANKSRPCDVPDWCIEPPDVFEPGYYLRQDIIWSKKNPMPESVTDRCTKSHEYIFLLSKSGRYYYNADAIREPLTISTLEREKYGRLRNEHKAFSVGVYHSNENMPSHFGSQDSNPLGRNRRSVWTVSTKPYPEAHFATFPKDLIRPCILAGCPVGGLVLDPFFGSGTTGEVALELNRNYLGIELNPEYVKLAKKRKAQPIFAALSGGIL